ncbi:hypothetical protein DFJ74DRAFT_693890 [Hyaloraphidium curvatum]|nr:hypothetical protein DFJ74DRAFT_693890 [Hyaloraphidium curvatum]
MRRDAGEKRGEGAEDLAAVAVAEERVSRFGVWEEEDEVGGAGAGKTPAAVEHGAEHVRVGVVEDDPGHAVGGNGAALGVRDGGEREGAQEHCRNLVLKDLVAALDEPAKVELLRGRRGGKAELGEEGAEVVGGEEEVRHVRAVVGWAREAGQRAQTLQGEVVQAAALLQVGGLEALVEQAPEEPRRVALQRRSHVRRHVLWSEQPLEHAVSRVVRRRHRDLPDDVVRKRPERPARPPQVVDGPRRAGDVFRGAKGAQHRGLGPQPLGRVRFRGRRVQHALQNDRLVQRGPGTDPTTTGAVCVGHARGVASRELAGGAAHDPNEERVAGGEEVQRSPSEHSCRSLGFTPPGSSTRSTSSSPSDSPSSPRRALPDAPRHPARPRRLDDARPTAKRRRRLRPRRFRHATAGRGRAARASTPWR